MTRMARSDAATRIRTWVVAATTRSTNHYTIRAKYSDLILILIIKTLFQEATHLTTRPASNNRNKLTNKLTIACTLECLIVTYLLRYNSRTKVSLTCFNVCFLCNKARYGRDDNPASNRL